jgi:hypothetical protein
VPQPCTAHTGATIAGTNHKILVQVHKPFLGGSFGWLALGLGLLRHGLSVASASTGRKAAKIQTDVMRHASPGAWVDTLAVDLVRLGGDLIKPCPT